jgi:hypothetical protein
MSHQNYISDAINHEAAVVAEAQASTRRAALNLGRFPGTEVGSVVGALLSARANGYVADHGEHPARNVIECGFKAGQRQQGETPRPTRAARRRMASESGRPLKLAAEIAATAEGL